jgi:hypothetical protein
MRARDEIQTILDHQQSLLQQYRSITIMFQAYLVAIVVSLYLQNSHFIALIALLLSICGAVMTYAMYKACNIRVAYVDSAQNMIYSIDRNEMSDDPGKPWQSLFRTIQSGEIIDGYNNEIAIIKTSIRNSTSRKRGFTRIVLTYLFHGIFALVWVGLIAALLIKVFLLK